VRQPLLLGRLQVRVMCDGLVTTLGRHDWEGQLKTRFTAHPKKDPVTGVPHHPPPPTWCRCHRWWRAACVATHITVLSAQPHAHHFTPHLPCTPRANWRTHRPRCIPRSVAFPPLPCPCPAPTGPALPRPAPPLSGKLHFFSYNFDATPFVTYGWVEPNGSLGGSVAVDLPRPVMMHDFAVGDAGKPWGRDKWHPCSMAAGLAAVPGPDLAVWVLVCSSSSANRERIASLLRCAHCWHGALCSSSIPACV
jgi:hypothetical protein